MQAIQNLGLAVISLLAGFIVDRLGYLYLEIFFIFWLTVALLATIAMWVLDWMKGKYLNMSIKQRKEYESRQRLTEDEVEGEGEGEAEVQAEEPAVQEEL